jgi:thiol:disulfide interchange protein DsbD
MAGAIGYALTQPPAVSMAVFLALALGFAAPFAALSFSPALLRRLPRPGPWMDVFRRAMAFPMYGAALWLAWVYAQQTGSENLAVLFGLGLLLAFVAWLGGRAQQPGGLPRPVLYGAVVVGAAALAAPAVLSEAAEPSEPVAAGAQAAAGTMPTEPFSPERLAALQAEGRPVFVNFTADWCVTCKVNERAALASDRVRTAFEETGVVYLKGDWTRRDAVIARTLAEHGRSGVPLYLLYTPGEARPQILPQLLTEGAVVAALNTAAAKES